VCCEYGIGNYTVTCGSEIMASGGEFEASETTRFVVPEVPEDPSEEPSFAPSESVVPSFKPSSEPSSNPSDAPSSRPSLRPSNVPSLDPSTKPSLVPSLRPSNVPSLDPSTKPSFVPSNEPSVSSEPSDQEASEPSVSPSSYPSLSLAPSKFCQEPGQEVVIVDIVTDDWPQETSWALTHPASGETILFVNEGDYERGPDSEKAIQYLGCTVQGESYEFTINDSYGDGVCCQYGNGSYTVTYAGTPGTFTGGPFGSSITESFDVS